MNITRLPLRIVADPRRVIARSFVPGGAERIRAGVARVATLSDADVAAMLAALTTDYGQRHKDIRGVFRQSYTTALGLIGELPEPNEDRRLLLGAYFTNEYSLESVALFNPSMVPHPDQEDLPEGSLRFVMSLRACGEGHISSIELRCGTIDAAHEVTVEAPTRFALTAAPQVDALYDKASYVMKLREMRAHGAGAEPVLATLGEHFTIRNLEDALVRCRPPAGGQQYRELAENMLWLAHSNYELDFSPEVALSERVIFPVSDNESRGIEDARFVRFVQEGRATYYATYTAYNGLRILPQLIETSDFRHFKINTLNGAVVGNKGMALFPRKIGDRFMMIGRQDGEKIYLLTSDNIAFWNESTLLYEPRHPWEFVQLGNCGSPIETDAGWLVLTHGVGPMRQYWMGAILLDLDDPTKVLGSLREPLLAPNEDERDGYVPNVVYSCGAILHRDVLVIPYAVSDSSTSIATVPLAELLDGLVS